MFVAAPGDLDDLRKETVRLLETLKKGTAGYEDYQVYDWKSEIGCDGFVDWEEPQEQIPPPSSRLCKGVVCLFGERIGTPLFPNVNLAELEEYLGAHASPKSGQEYRLVHPWPTDAEKIEREITNGGFPLTGTVFECLVALNANKANRSIRSDGLKTSPGNPPILILFIGAGGDFGDADVEEGGWGQRRLFERTIAFYQEKSPRKWTQPLEKWRVETYVPQLRQLQNFHRYLADVERDEKSPVEEEDARVRIEKFLRTWVIKGDPIDERAIRKGLLAYDEDDADCFFGRGPELRDAIHSLEELWERPGPTFYPILGPSGVGKSSFLRAGLIGQLLNRPPRGLHTYQGFAIRPGELLLGKGQLAKDRPANPLHNLFDRVLENLSKDESLSPKVEKVREDLRTVQREIGELVGQDIPLLQGLPKERQVDAAVGRLHEILESGRQRLLIGLDQFEEIVDQLSTPDLRRMWEPLIEFISRAAQSESVGIAYTLQSNRIDAMCADPALGPLFAKRRSLNLIGDANLDSMIRDVFSRAKVTLDDQLAEELGARIQAFAESNQAARASLMPLVSLTLLRIYETVVLPARAASTTDSREDEGSGDADATVSASSGAPPPEKTTGMSQTFSDASTVGSIGVADDTTGAPAASNVATAQAVKDVILVSAKPTASPESHPAFAAGEGSLRVVVEDHLLDVGRAIADHADAALKNAEQSTGPALSDDTLGSLLDRFVSPANLNEHRYNLPPAPIPTDWARRRLAEEFIRERLLIPDAKRSDYARLVHEAILLYWKKAEKWLGDHRSLMASQEDLTGAARSWERDGYPPEKLTSFEADKAGELLLKRWEVFFASDADADLARLKKFGLALLAKCDNPTAVVPNTDHGTLHIEVAALHGDVALVRHYLERCPEAAQTERSDKRTPLFAACFSGSEEIARLLIEAGAYPSQQDAVGWQPIHFAASLGSQSLMRILIEAGVSPVARGPGKQTPLHVATRSGQMEIVKYLSNKPETDLNDPDATGQCPLHMAVELRMEPMVRTLLDLHADPNRPDPNGNTALHLATRSSYVDTEIIRLLVTRGANILTPAKDGQTALHIAAERGHKGAVEALLEGLAPSDVDPPRTSDERTPLLVAAENGHTEVAAALIARGADPNKTTNKGRSALHIAAEKGYSDLARLLKGRVDVALLDEKGSWPLQIALASGQFSVAEVLVSELGAPLDIPRQAGLTLLHLAALGGREQQVLALLKVGADPNVTDPHGSTPLHLAAETGRETIVRILLGHRVTDAMAREVDGSTPLHVAAERGHLLVAGLLLEHSPMGRDIPDDRGWTPLHLAARAGHAEIVRTLFAAGAAPGGGPLSPLTPLQAAAEVGNDEIVALLLEAGANVDSFTEARAAPVVLSIRNASYAVALSLIDAGAHIPLVSTNGDISLGEAFAANRMLRARVGEDWSAAEAEVARRLIAVGVDLPFDPPGPEVRFDERLAGSIEPSHRGGSVQTYPWVAADADLRARVLGSISPPIDGKLVLNPARVRVATTCLPWYPNETLLIRLTDEDWPEGLAVYYLMLGDQLERLDGNANPIHEINAKAPIKLSEQNVLEYLRFFGFFVRGDEGPFYIVETIDDPVLPQGLDHPTRESLESVLRPATFEGHDHQDRYLCDGVVFYSNALFIASFFVDPSGLPGMLDDEPIATNLPVRIHAPIKYIEPTGGSR